MINAYRVDFPRPSATMSMGNIANVGMVWNITDHRSTIFFAMLWDLTTSKVSNNNVWTIVRGQEGTTQQVFNQGDYAQLRLTAGQIQYFQTAQFSTQEEYQIATQGQTVFDITGFQYAPNTDNIAVFVDGVKQISGVANQRLTDAQREDYTASFRQALRIREEQLASDSWSHSRAILSSL